MVVTYLDGYERMCNLAMLPNFGGYACILQVDMLVVYVVKILGFGVGVGQVYIGVPMFCRNVDSFPFRQILGTPYVLKLAKVMPNFSVDFYFFTN